MEIKVGYLVAYDYELLKQSLPTVYRGADKIVVAIDKNRRTFAGGSYTIDPSFFDWLKAIDIDNKITLYEDEFYKDGLSANEADTRERNLLSEKLGAGGWHFHIDVDEYFVNFDALVKEVRKLEQKVQGRKVTIQIACDVLFKQSERGFFIVDGSPEQFSIATNHPSYTLHRNSDGNERIFVNHLILHQSWGRTEEDLQRKLLNWSHHSDFDTKSYFNFWKSVNEDNYQYIRDFHPLFPDYWKKLKFVEGKSIDEILQKTPSTIPELRKVPFQKIQKWVPPFIFNRLTKAR